MARRKQTPARTPEARENQLINMAVDETERRLRNGTISSQLLAILLKLATTRAQLELEKLKSDIALQKAKETEIVERSSDRELFEEALKAFTTYKGGSIDDEEDDDYL